MNIEFLKGLHCKIQTLIRWKFCGKPGKRMFFKIKKSFNLAFKIGKIIDFIIYKKKKKISKKAIPAVTLIYLYKLTSKTIN